MYYMGSPPKVLNRRHYKVAGEMECGWQNAHVLMLVLRTN
jgi:hypothetical protein